jgi:endonuclease/exonuclease/phosphatase family metal-dependent hydrolase
VRPSRRFATLIFSTLGFGILPGAWFYTTLPVSVAPVVKAASAGPHLTVLTLNLAKVTETDQIARELRPADIYLFQEVVKTSPKLPSVAENVARKLGWNVQFGAAVSGATESGIAVVSRFTLSDPHVYKINPINLIFRSRQRALLAVTAQTPAGPVRIVCAHLDTRINPADRLRELAPAIEDGKQFSGPVLIGGDFNTNDMQWVSHVVPVPWPGWQAARVRDLMAQNGYNTPFMNRRATFDHLGMQLDWIFLRNLATIRADIVPMAFSDHHALVAVVGPPGPEKTAEVHHE